MINQCIVIPAYNPDNQLIDYVKKLISVGAQRIIIIDDGSKEECRLVFSEADKLAQVVLLTHAVNMGKGRALKDAFNYYLVHIMPSGLQGVITVDSDGQHTVQDIVKIDNEMRKFPNSLILGVRDFDDTTVPPKSKFGNKLTRIVLRLLIGGDITDTQTGLRGIPNKYLNEWTVLSGERFEYETTMLIDSIRSTIDVREVKIQTVYINDNKETHFNPIKDSIAIYKIIFGTFFKYITASAVSFIIDYGMFCVFILLLSFMNKTIAIWISTVVARVVSSLFNYALNKNIVFKSNSGKKTVVQYYLLCICQMVCSALLVNIFSNINVIPVQTAKIIVDICLFMISFQIQSRIIFKKKEAEYD